MSSGASLYTTSGDEAGFRKATKAPPNSDASPDYSKASLAVLPSNDSLHVFAERCKCVTCRQNRQMRIYHSKSMTLLETNYIKQNIRAAKKFTKEKKPNPEEVEKVAIVDSVRGKVLKTEELIKCIAI